MNTIPKLKINQIAIKDSSDFKDIVLNSNYNQMRFFWNKPQEIELAGIDCCLSSEYSSIKEFNELSKYYRDVIKYNYRLLSDLDTPIVFIANSFDMDSKDAESPWTKFPKGIIFIPERIYINKNGIKKLVTINENTTKENNKNISNKTTLKLESETSNNTFSNMIDDSIKMIEKKEISKIVLSREKKFKFNFNADRQFNFLSKAESNFPDCTAFLYDFKNLGIFFGVTPETLFKTKQKEFYAEALAGTFHTKDNLHLLDKSKELDEHNFVVEYIKKRVSKFSNNINYSKEPYFIKLNSITHMKTEFISELKSEIDPFDIIHNLHPTPAVCGTPTNTAISNIRKLEPHQRGWYSGTLGWMDSEYNSHFIVSIRSGLSVDDNLYMYAGCGITKNSDKDIEYHESEIKFNSILSILNDE